MWLGSVMKVVTNLFFAMIFFVIIDVLFFGGREIAAIADNMVGADQNVTSLLGTFMDDIRYAGCRQIGLVGPSCSIQHVGFLL